VDWCIGALGSDLHLGDDIHIDDDDSTVNDGVHVYDVIGGDHISDSGLWDEPAIAAWRIPQRLSCETFAVPDVDDDVGTLSSSRSGSQLQSQSDTSRKLKSDTIASIFDRHVPDLMAPGTECWSCVACQSLCFDSGESSCRDALRFVSSGGFY
jgi:hypothetical protein